jgi:hypothetical protein
MVLLREIYCRIFQPLSSATEKGCRIVATTFIYKMSLKTNNLKEQLIRGGGLPVLSGGIYALLNFCL